MTHTHRSTGSGSRSRGYDSMSSAYSSGHHSCVEPRAPPLFDRVYAKHLSLARRSQPPPNAPPCCPVTTHPPGAVHACGANETRYGMKDNSNSTNQPCRVGHSSESETCRYKTSRWGKLFCMLQSIPVVKTHLLPYLPFATDRHTVGTLPNSVHTSFAAIDTLNANGTTDSNTIPNTLSPPLGRSGNVWEGTNDAATRQANRQRTCSRWWQCGFYLLFAFLSFVLLWSYAGDAGWGKELAKTRSRYGFDRACEDVYVRWNAMLSSHAARTGRRVMKSSWPWRVSSHRTHCNSSNRGNADNTHSSDRDTTRDSQTSDAHDNISGNHLDGGANNDTHVLGDYAASSATRSDGKSSGSGSRNSCEGASHSSNDPRGGFSGEMEGAGGSSKSLLQLWQQQRRRLQPAWENRALWRNWTPVALPMQMTHRLWQHARRQSMWSNGTRFGAKRLRAMRRALGTKMKKHSPKQAVMRSRSDDDDGHMDSVSTGKGDNDVNREYRTEENYRVTMPGSASDRGGVHDDDGDGYWRYSLAESILQGGFAFGRQATGRLLWLPRIVLYRCVYLFYSVVDVAVRAVWRAYSSVARYVVVANKSTRNNTNTNVTHSRIVKSVSRQNTVPVENRAAQPAASSIRINTSARHQNTKSGMARAATNGGDATSMGGAHEARVVAHTTKDATTRTRSDTMRGGEESANRVTRHPRDDIATSDARNNDRVSATGELHRATHSQHVPWHKTSPPVVEQSDSMHAGHALNNNAPAHASTPASARHTAQHEHEVHTVRDATNANTRSDSAEECSKAAALAASSAAATAAAFVKQQSLHIEALNAAREEAEQQHAHMQKTHDALRAELVTTRQNAQLDCQRECNNTLSAQAQRERAQCEHQLKLARAVVVQEQQGACEVRLQEQQQAEQQRHRERAVEQERTCEAKLRDVREETDRMCALRSHAGTLSHNSSRNNDSNGKTTSTHGSSVPHEQSCRCYSNHTHNSLTDAALPIDDGNTHKATKNTKAKNAKAAMLWLRRAHTSKSAPDPVPIAVTAYPHKRRGLLAYLYRIAAVRWCCHAMHCLLQFATRTALVALLIGVCVQRVTIQRLRRGGAPRHIRPSGSEDTAPSGHGSTRTCAKCAAYGDGCGARSLHGAEAEHVQLSGVPETNARAVSLLSMDFTVCQRMCTAWHAMMLSWHADMCIWLADCVGIPGSAARDAPPSSLPLLTCRSLPCAASHAGAPQQERERVPQHQLRGIIGSNSHGVAANDKSSDTHSDYSNRDSQDGLAALLVCTESKASDSHTCSGLLRMYFDSMELYYVDLLDAVMHREWDRAELRRLRRRERDTRAELMALRESCARYTDGNVVGYDAELHRRQEEMITALEGQVQRLRDALSSTRSVLPKASSSGTSTTTTTPLHIARNASSTNDARDVHHSVSLLPASKHTAGVMHVYTSSRRLEGAAANNPAEAEAAQRKTGVHMHTLRHTDHVLPHTSIYHAVEEESSTVNSAPSQSSGNDALCGTMKHTASMSASVDSRTAHISSAQPSPRPSLGEAVAMASPHLTRWRSPRSLSSIHSPAYSVDDFIDHKSNESNTKMNSSSNNNSNAIPTNNNSNSNQSALTVRKSVDDDTIVSTEA